MDKIYIDDELEKIVDDAINKAIANLYLEGIIVSSEEKKKFKEEFLNNYKIKILKGKK